MYKLDKAGNFIEFKNGKSIKPGGQGDYPVYGANGIIGMSNEHRERNSVIIGRVGAYCGSVQFCRGRYWASDNTIVACPMDNKTDVVYLYYELKNAKLNRWAGGAAQPLMTQTVIKQIELPHPDINVQRKASSVLSAYDDLITKNSRRVQIIEEMVQRIYREWFVDFRFPRHKKTKFVDSVMGKIPENWKLQNLGDLVECCNEGTQAGEHLSGRKYVPIDCISRKSIALTEARPWTEAQSSLQLFQKGNILFGAMRPYFHKVAIAPFDGVTRTTCFVLRPKDYQTFSYALMTIFREETIAFATTSSQGATIPYAVWNNSMEKMRVLVPTLNVIKEFEDCVSPLLKYIQGTYWRESNLKYARDILIPKLISGEIDVLGMDIAIQGQENGA